MVFWRVRLFCSPSWRPPPRLSARVQLKILELGKFKRETVLSPMLPAARQLSIVSLASVGLEGVIKSPLLVDRAAPVVPTLLMNAQRLTTASKASLPLSTQIAPASEPAWFSSKRQFSSRKEATVFTSLQSPRAPPMVPAVFPLKVQLVMAYSEVSAPVPEPTSMAPLAYGLELPSNRQLSTSTLP